MMKFSTNWLTELFPVFKGSPQDQIEIRTVFTDSRSSVKMGLFVPIVGDRFDGHEFLNDAVQQGAVATIWQRDHDIPAFLPKDFPVFLVDDSIEALQYLAKAYRQKVNPKVIGITGSNGKTTTKDLVAAAVSSQYETLKTQGNYNNHIGLPLTLLSMPNNCEVAVLEMGMNHFGEIQILSQIAQPDIAIITNIGESHIEFLGSRAGIAQAKAEILAGLKEEGVLIIDGDEPLLQPLVKQKNTIRCGFKEENDYKISEVTLSTKTMSFKLNQEISFSIPLLGEHNARNTAFAIAVGDILQIPVEKMIQSIKDLKVTSARFEILNGKNGSTLVNDSYNASPTSMKASINVFKQMEGKKKIVVLGDMFELGEHGEDLHRSVAEVITSPINAVYTLGNMSHEITKEVQHQQPNLIAKHFDNKKQLLTELEDSLKKDTIILFKASRGMKLETLLTELTQ